MEPKKTTGNTPDRIWYTNSVKLNLGDYQSASVDAGMSTDVRPGETVQAAFARCHKILEPELEAQVERIRDRQWVQL